MAEPAKQFTFEDWLAIARYEGPVDPKIDFDRLQTQTAVIRNLMIDGKFRTLEEIEKITGYPQASVSAQLRHLEKARFGGHIKNKRRRYENGGTWEYQILERTYET